MGLHCLCCCGLELWTGSKAYANGVGGATVKSWTPKKEMSLNGWSDLFVDWEFIGGNCGVQGAFMKMFVW